MIKEYSDLSDKQKITYIKQNIIVLVFSIIPFLIVSGLFIGALSQLPENPVSEIDITNSTSIEVETDSTPDWRAVVIVIFFFGSVIGLVGLGIDIGKHICDKLNLYTDFDLEHTEKRLAKIKEVLK